MFILFFVYFISALAEGSRTPFDLPEAESELVSGYNTEYSGFRFAAYFLAEFANTWIAAAVGVIAFLGGWQIPFVSLEVLESATGLQAVGLELASLVVFVLKTLALVFLIIQLRWTLPRIRVDQMMSLCWKYLVPTVFICTILMLGWMIILPWESMVALGIRVLMFLMGVGLLVAYVVRIRYNIIAAGDKVYTKWAV
jgi:NADH-quinone oxidoreductase subunit H